MCTVLPSSISIVIRAKVPFTLGSMNHTQKLAIAVAVGIIQSPHELYQQRGHFTKIVIIASIVKCGQIARELGGGMRLQRGDLEIPYKAVLSNI